MIGKPDRTYVIEVISAEPDNIEWTAMADSYDGILRELTHAPVAALITVYEWQRVLAVNPRDWFTKFPTWRFIGTYPWTLRGPARNASEWQ